MKIETIVATLRAAKSESQLNHRLRLFGQNPLFALLFLERPELAVQIEEIRSALRERGKTC